MVAPREVWWGAITAVMRGVWLREYNRQSSRQAGNDGSEDAWVVSRRVFPNVSWWWQRFRTDCRW